MNPQLTAFLQYDYAEARTIATTLLTISGGLLAGGILFGEKYGNLHRATGKPFRVGMFGLYAFATAGLSAGLALLTNYGGMVRMLRRYGGGVRNPVDFAADVAAHNLGNALLFILSGAIMALGMLCLFMSADSRQKERELERTKAEAERKPELPPTSPVAASTPPTTPVLAPVQSQAVDGSKG